MNPETTIAQLGGRGLSGALVYCGVKDTAFSKKTNTMYFTVNGKRGYKTIITIKLEFSDTYTVRLLSMKPLKPSSEDTVSYERKDVYCDELQQVFEEMYDTYIKENNDGFIPVS